jgi:hypothetical protein
MRILCFLLAGCLALPATPAAFAQEAVHRLNLVIIEGEGVINNIRQRTAREPIVEVEDENHKPVAGAAVVFLLPERGAGGTFADGSHSLSVTTDAQGRAASHGMRLNHTQGQFTIQVTATFNGLTASAVITQSIGAAAAGGATAAAGGLSTKLIVILAIAAGAAAGGAIYATHSGGGNSSGAAAATTISAGAGTVGPPK